MEIKSVVGQAVLEQILWKYDTIFPSFYRSMFQYSLASIEVCFNIS